MAVNFAAQVGGAIARPSLPRVSEPATPAWLYLVIIGLLGASTLWVLRDTGPSSGQASSISKALGVAPVRQLRGGHPTPTALSATAAGETVAAAAVDREVATVSQPAQAGEPAVAEPSSAAPAIGSRARISGTDGVGVVLRTAPREDARVPRGLAEGIAVTILARDGESWVEVKADNGQQGWVPGRYLASQP